MTPPAPHRAAIIKKRYTVQIGILAEGGAWRNPSGPIFMKSTTENYTFMLENSSINIRKYKYDERNMLGYLCFKHIYYTEYRAANDGFFYVSSNEIQNAVGISKNTVTTYAVKFAKDGLIDYISGTTHRPSRYRILFQFVFFNENIHR